MYILRWGTEIRFSVGALICSLLLRVRPGSLLKLTRESADANDISLYPWLHEIEVELKYQ